MTLKSGLAGFASAVVKGKGADLPMPSLANLTLPLYVQLWADNGKCWQAGFTAADASKNDGTQFSGKGIPIGLYGLNLLEQKFQSVELARDLISEMTRYPSTIAG